MMFSCSFLVRRLLVDFGNGRTIRAMAQTARLIRYENEDIVPLVSNSYLAADQLQLNEKERHLGLLKHFNLGEGTLQRLKARGIEFLLPVQYSSYNEIMAGKDCIVQARTGTGKTLAFSLPLVERLQSESRKDIGRLPRCLVLEPTRELAKQISADFLSIKSSSLSVATLYGGKEYSFQESSIRRGCDIVVGTPGRIKDFLYSKKLSLSQCRFIVLDEVDRMLDMGFKDDVDEIIQFVNSGDIRAQMIVFSATVPPWVRRSLSRYMSNNQPSIVNLVGDSQKATAINVEHLSIQSNNIHQRPSLVSSLFNRYSSDRNDGRAIIFCETKRECDELARSNEMRSLTCDVLHGDISQKRREQVLSQFRQGGFRLLITTDVSARGLDIPQVDLVIVTSPPKDWESYVHRSGRTGRAGKQGKSICIYARDQIKQLQSVEQRAKMQFISIDSPSTSMNKEENSRKYSMKLTKQVFNGPALLYSTLRRCLGSRLDIKSVTFSNDRKSVTFDLPESLSQILEQKWRNSATIELERIDSPIIEQQQQ